MFKSAGSLCLCFVSVAKLLKEDRYLWLICRILQLEIFWHLEACIIQRKPTGDMGVFLGVQLRGKEVIRIQNFKVASKEDVAAVHSMGYVKGLERVSHCLFSLSFANFFCAQGYICICIKDVTTFCGSVSGPKG